MPISASDIARALEAQDVLVNSKSWRVAIIQVHPPMAHDNSRVVDLRLVGKPEVELRLRVTAESLSEFQATTADDVAKARLTPWLIDHLRRFFAFADELREGERREFEV